MRFPARPLVLAPLLALAALLVLAPLLALAAFIAVQDATPAAAAKQEAARKKPSGKAKKAARKPSRKKKKAAKPPTPASELFGAAKTPAPFAARAIGFYAKGCLAGAAALPTDGPAWQAMRLSRNRNWGHPVLVALIEKLAVEAKEHDGFSGLLVGDLSQPRGGPLPSDHVSHQVGLDADVWFTPMPDRRLSEKEREELSATSMVAADRVSVNPKVWTDAHVRVLKRAASYKEVERILVHPAIKKAVCEASAKDKDRAWLRKIRPYWGHDDHFHLRIGCPKGSTSCKSQPPVGRSNGCGAELRRWLRLVKTPPKPGAPAPKRKPITLSQLPDACRAVLAAAPAAPSEAAKGPSVAAQPAANKATLAK